MSAFQMKTESLMKVRQQLVEARMAQTPEPFCESSQGSQYFPGASTEPRIDLHGNPQLVQEVLLRIV